MTHQPGARGLRYFAGASSVAVVVAGATCVAVIAVLIAQHPWDNDAHGFWLVRHRGLYALPWLAHGAYVYSPAFAEALAWWTLLQWPVAWALWVGLQFAALLWMLGPALGAVVLLLPWPSLPDHGNAVYGTIYNGNPQILLAAAIVFGMRFPATWSFVLLTKVTPGIGLLWFAVRREWRAFGFAVVATAAIIAVSLVLNAGLWAQWLKLLATAMGADALAKEPILPLPLVVRLPCAVIIVAVGALRNRRWTVPIACTLALPAIQVGGFAVAVGAIPLWLADSDTRVAAALRAYLGWSVPALRTGLPPQVDRNGR